MAQQPIIDLAPFYEQYRQAEMKSSIRDGNQGQPAIKENSAGDRYVLFLNTQCARCDDWFSKVSRASTARYGH